MFNGIGSKPPHLIWNPFRNRLRSGAVFLFLEPVGTGQRQQDKVLVFAEDFATLYKVNERWPGHAVLVPPALEAAAGHKFGSQGFLIYSPKAPASSTNSGAWLIMSFTLMLTWSGYLIPFLI